MCLSHIFLGTFSCDSLSCVSSNVQSKRKHRNANNNNNNNNNNNTTTQSADEQNHLLEFYVFDINNERHLHLTNDTHDKRLIIFYNISNGLYTIGIRNGKLSLYHLTTNVVVFVVVYLIMYICYCSRYNNLIR